MTIYDPGVREGRIAAGARLVVGVSGAVLQRSRELGRGQGGTTGARPSLGAWIVAGSRLVAPLLLLGAAGAAVVVDGTESLPWLGASDVGGMPFNVGMLALPVTLFVVQLTNRRYGAGYALAQILVAAFAGAIALTYFGDDLAALRGQPLPDSRVLTGFGCGLFAAHIVAIVVFESMRGPQWWQAPFASSLIGGAILALLSYPVAYAGTDAAWHGPMLSYLALTSIAAIVFLVPYCALRSAVEPLPGFGGY